MFESNHSRHFQSNYKKKVSCTKLLSDGKVISDPDELVAVWESYFKSLATSKYSSNPQLMSSLQKLNVLEAETCRTCNPILGDSKLLKRLRELFGISNLCALAVLIL